MDLGSSGGIAGAEEEGEMARSPLFRALRCVALRARAAHLGVSSMELARAPPREGLSRREVLFASLGTAAIWPLAPAYGDRGSRGWPSIAIVGAGIAGLTAA